MDSNQTERKPNREEQIKSLQALEHELTSQIQCLKRRIGKVPMERTGVLLPVMSAVCVLVLVTVGALL